MILIISEPADIHSTVVAQRLLERGEDVCILSTEHYPQQCNISWHVRAGAPGFSLKYGERVIASDEVRGVWVRRLKPFAIAPSVVDRQVEHFSYNECRDFFIGWLSTFDNVINACQQEYLAARKLMQLYCASGLGLRTPETLISNDPEKIEAFYHNRKCEIIFKPLTGTAFQFTGAHLFDDAHLQTIQATSLAPCIFQERITVKENLRITIIDQDVFAASIKVGREYAKIDWRLERSPVIEPYKLPVEIEDKLIKLQRRLGLRYGAIDMILNEQDEYVFLENNPGGQFLFIEVPTRMPISQALAGALLTRAANDADHGVVSGGGRPAVNA